MYNYYRKFNEINLNRGLISILPSLFLALDFKEAAVATAASLALPCLH